MMPPPLVSVVLPVYNAEAFLDEAIESILNQSYRNFELIIINDGSTDSSQEIIKRYRSKDKRIRVVERENRGLVYSLNEGVSLARGKYIARMDADDISLADRFMEQVKVLESMPQIDIVGCRYELVDSHSNVIKEAQVPIDTRDFCLILCYTVPFAHASVMVRKEVFKIAKYEEVPTEDYLLWCKLYHPDNFYNIDKVLLRYRHQYGSSFSDTKRLEMIESEKRTSKLFFSKNKKHIKDTILETTRKNIFLYRALVSIFLYSDKKYVLVVLFKKPDILPGFGKYFLRHWLRMLLWKVKTLG